MELKHNQIIQFTTKIIKIIKVLNLKKKINELNVCNIVYIEDDYF